MLELNMEIFQIMKCENGHELHRVLTGFRNWKAWNRLLNGKYVVDEVCAACGKGVSLISMNEKEWINCDWCNEKLLCSCRS